MLPERRFGSRNRNLTKLNFHLYGHGIHSTRCSGLVDIGDVHEFRVHWIRMRNVTFSADDTLIDEARHVARSRNITLNQAFREWLADYTSRTSAVRRFEETMEQLPASGVRAGRKFTREEMNER